MFAVAHRAYPAALAIFKAAFGLAKDCSADEEMKEPNRCECVVGGFLLTLYSLC